ncbi:MAG: hypothetical protein EOP56_19170 [Sphingobacteriales bacterium]|nr:MAG: hypothetical protein EOP56_19170 [Sphingobacteriales bacterium]
MKNKKGFARREKESDPQDEPSGKTKAVILQQSFRNFKVGSALASGLGRDARNHDVVFKRKIWRLDFFVTFFIKKKSKSFLLLATLNLQFGIIS